MKKAYAGSLQTVPAANTFDFLFSNPFEHESPHTPKSLRVPRIPDERPIYVDEASNRSLTYSVLKRDSVTIAWNLLSLNGLSPDVLTKLPPTPSCPQGPEVPPVVLIHLPTCVPFSPLLFGVLAAHLAASLVSPALTAAELTWVLHNARPSVIVTASATLPAMKEALAAQDDKSWFDKVPLLSLNVAEDNYPSLTVPESPSDWKLLLKPNFSHHRPAVRQPYDPASRTAVILWSSGTSGRPKGVLLSHHGLNFSTASLWHDTEFYRSPEPQRWLGFVPFCHVFGLTNLVLPAAASGSTVYTMPAFKLDLALAAIERRRITYLHMAPPVAIMLAKAPLVGGYLKRDREGKHGFSSVSGGVSGGAPLGHDIIAQVYDRLGFRIRRGYGLTEACSVTLQRGLERQDMASSEEDVGVPHWGVELMVADKTSFRGGKTVPAVAGVVGEILLKSPELLTAYLPPGLGTPSFEPDMSTTQSAMTMDGWFYTGDVGTITASGRLIVTDRIKEMIKVNGYQVAPAELEAILCSDRGVSDAAVVPFWEENQATELPRAFIKATRNNGREMNEEQRKTLAMRLKRLVEGRTARYKWLRGGVVFVEAIPRSPSGKILRRVLRDSPVQGQLVDLYEKRRVRL